MLTDRQVQGIRREIELFNDVSMALAPDDILQLEALGFEVRIVECGCMYALCDIRLKPTA